jgi:hypothetical protein
VLFLICALFLNFVFAVLTSTPLMLSAGTEAMQAGTSSFPSPSMLLEEQIIFYSLMKSSVVS